MKANLKISLAMLLIALNSTVIYSQTWNYGGNGVAGVTNFGTTTNFDLPFVTNSTEKARLLKTGELGIGTTTPSSWLHVITTGTKESFRTDVPSGYDNYWRMYRAGVEYGRFLNFDGNSAFYMQAPRGAIRIAAGNAGTSIPAIQILGGSGSNAGAVGLGNYTSFTPDASFHVKGNGYTYLYKLESSSLSTPTVIINNDEQQFYKANTFTGSALQGAFNFDYSPSTAITSGIGSYLKTLANASSSLEGLRLSVESTNSTSASVSGIIIDSKTSATATGFNYAVLANCYGAKTDNIAGQFNSVQTNTQRNAGITIAAKNSNVNLGLYAEASNISGSVLKSVGVEAKAYGGTNGSIGVLTEAADYTNGDIYGIKTEAINNGSFSGTNAWYGIYSTAPVQTCSNLSCAGAAGFFNGDVYATNGSYSSSDLKLKDQIIPINNASSLLTQIQARQFIYKTSAFPELNLPNGQHYGFIAQDVEAILPTLVKEFKNPEKLDSAGNIIYNSVDVKAIHYEEFIPILVAAFNEQKVLIDSLLALQTPVPLQIKNQQNAQRITLSNISSIILNQNDPNPFTESTRITYSIPENIKEAKIIFTTTSGAIINTAIINERGAGQLEVYSSELNKGIYIYTLVCDGQVISTKKMVKQ